MGDDLLFQPQQEAGLYAVRGVSGEPLPPEPLEFLKVGQRLSSWAAACRTVGVVVLGDRGGLAISRDAGHTWDAPVKDLYGGTVVVSASDTGDQILHQSSETTQLDNGDGVLRKVKRPGDTVADFRPLPEGGWITADRVHGLCSTADWKTFSRIGVPSAPVTALAVSGETVLAGTETGLFRAPPCRSPTPTGSPPTGCSSAETTSSTWTHGPRARRWCGGLGRSTWNPWPNAVPTRG
ncbi:hypothetical protein ABT224_28160 [Streptomyces sp. NPDC001584]|uniref:hypothetical protein n=1 Tax=Streptomyces sp. NPDC001584 TaxID=3154521 RepID=UPI0033197057